MQKEIIIIADSRCGDSGWFKNIKEFRKQAYACGWTRQEFSSFINDESDPANVHTAEFVRPLENGGLYVVERYRSRYEPVYTYYKAYAGGEVKLIDTLDHEADEEELEEILAGEVM